MHRAPCFVMIPFVLFGSASATAQSEPVSRLEISTAAIQAAVNKVRAYKPKDRFDAGPDVSALVGKSFQMETPLKAAGLSNTICPGSPFYNYSPESAKLEISYGGRYEPNDFNPAIAPSHREHPGQFSFACVVTRGRSYFGENSFGAVASVEVRNEKFSAFVSSQLMSEPYFAGFDWSIQADPATARNLAKAVRVRVRGTIGEWSGGRPIKCAAHTEAAKIDFPEETNQEGCFINADIVEAEIINSATGEVLHSGIASRPH